MGVIEDIFKSTRSRGSRRLSLDMKLSYAFFVPMMILFALSGMSGKRIPTQVLTGIACGILALIAVISCIHKANSGWRWPGLTFGKVGSTLFGILWGAGFLVFAASLWLPREEKPWRQGGLPEILSASWDAVVAALSSSSFLAPFMIFGVGMFLFGTLQSLGFIDMYQDEFEKHCEKEPSFDSPKPSDSSTEDIDSYESEPLLGIDVAVLDRFLTPLCWTAGVGFALSLLAHLLAMRGINLGSLFPPIWFLHVVIFAVWVPTIVIVACMSPRPTGNDFWKVATRHSPLWMRALCILLIPYAVINFMMAADADSGGAPEAVVEQTADATDQMDEPIVAEPKANTWPAIRGFSGHWMIFYMVGWTVLVSHTNRRRKDFAPPPIP